MAYLETGLVLECLDDEGNFVDVKNECIDDRQDNHESYLLMLRVVIALECLGLVTISINKKYSYFKCYGYINQSFLALVFFRDWTRYRETGKLPWISKFIPDMYPAFPSDLMMGYRSKISNTKDTKTFDTKSECAD